MMWRMHGGDKHIHAGQRIVEVVLSILFTLFNLNPEHWMVSKLLAFLQKRIVKILA